MGSSTRLLRELISEIVLEEPGIRRLRVFDFDDTLVRTDAMVHVTDANGITHHLTSHEYAFYERKEGDTLDYCDFERLINPRPIRWTNKVLRTVHEKYGPSGVAVMSARGNGEPIRQFLSNIGYNEIEIIAIGNSDPQLKAKWIDERIVRDGLDLVEFFDDSHRYNVAVNCLRHKHPNVRIITHEVTNTYWR